MASMQVQAAVASEPGEPFEIETLELEDPREHEVLVRVVATGICQTDLHIRDRDYPVPFPVVPGHEGAGVVEQVGASVSTVSPGDHVVLSYPFCGHCSSCLRARYPYCQNGFLLSFGGSRADGSTALSRADGSVVHGHIFQQSSFATHALASESNVVRVPKEAPLDRLGPLACSIQTGAGAVLEALAVPAGASLAVFGAGSVGLAAVMAARHCGAHPIIAVDVVDERLRLARELGATHTIDAADQDVVDAIQEFLPVGAEFVLEVTGRPEMLAQALQATAMTGTAALVGGAPAGVEAPIDMTTLLNGRTLRGIVQGDAVEQLFIPKLLGMHQRGELPFEQLVRFYDFHDINQAVADMQAGRCVKPILRMEGEAS